MGLLKYMFRCFIKCMDITSKTPLRLKVWSDDATDDFPILVVVRQQKGVLSWQLPYIVNSDNTPVLEQYNFVSRTLCPVSYHRTNKSGSQESSKTLTSERNFDEDVTISISTASTKHVNFSLLASIDEDFNVERFDVTKNTEVSPSEPRIFSFEFVTANLTDPILLEVNSSSSICMTISLQNLSCPVYDLQGNVQFKGYRQTMSKKGGIILTRDSFLKEGFFIVLVVHADDSICLEKKAMTPNVMLRTKDVQFTIKSIRIERYGMAISAAVAFFLLFYVVTLVVNSVFGANNERTPDEETVPLLHSVNQHQEDVTETQNENGGTQEENEGLSSLAKTLKEKIDAGEELFLSDISRKGCPNLRENSKLYLWNLITVGIFYALPVVQLVIILQKMSNSTGDRDICFYNFLCSHPLGFLSDFNHIFSNIGYLMLGLLFIFLVRIKSRRFSDMIKANPSFDEECGIPQQFGLFYAMGTALVAEGVLSACYHVCPNHTNFQFDTSFMYVIAMMCMLRIYQNRHPDIHASAYTTFGALAFVIFIGMIGVLEGGTPFWVIFTIVHAVACIWLSAQVYFMGFWSLDKNTMSRICASYSCQQNNNKSFWLRLKPIYPFRMVLLCIGLVANVCISIYGLVVRPNDFASYLLLIFMANLIIYFVFYTIMKLIHKEYNLLLFIYIVFFAIFGCLSLKYFLDKHSSWDDFTPALSREYNQPCELLGFYDSHDIWHFLSAAAMFFSFMVLLTIDDDLRFVKRSEISIF